MPNAQDQWVLTLVWNKTVDDNVTVRKESYENNEKGFYSDVPSINSSILNEFWL